MFNYSGNIPYDVSYTYTQASIVPFSLCRVSSVSSSLCAGYRLLCVAIALADMAKVKVLVSRRLVGLPLDNGLREENHGLDSPNPGSS